MMFRPRDFLSLTVENASYKIIAYSVTIAIANEWVDGLYVSITPMLLTALCLAAIGSIAEPIVLPRLGALKSLLPGCPAMTFIIWFVGRLVQGEFNLMAAFAITLMIGPIEYLFHVWLLRRLHVL
jgi:hypothetical protein